MRTKKEVKRQFEQLKSLCPDDVEPVFYSRRLWALIALRWVLEPNYAAPMQHLAMFHSTGRVTDYGDVQWELPSWAKEMTGPAKE